MDLTTPALLFPAISLLMLAYGNRFLTLGQIVRQLHPGEEAAPSLIALAQLPSLRARITLVKWMQGLGALSFFGCAASMFALFLQQVALGRQLFGIAIVLLALSLLLSLIEILASTRALSLVLADIEARAGR